MRSKFIFTLVLILCVFVTILNPLSFSANKEKLMPAVHKFLASGEEGRLKVWIFFRDHGEKNSEELSDALSGVELTSRALKRRANRSRGPLVDVRDLPVHEVYLDKLRSLGIRLKRTSKYLNAVSAMATAGQLRRLSELRFVSKIDRVASFRRPICEPVKIIDPPSRRGETAPGRGQEPNGAAQYGDSYRQLDQINVIPLHDSNLHGEGVLVAMLDTGFNRSHEALDHLDIVGEWDFIYEDSVTKDQPNDSCYAQHSHGTYTLSALGGYAPGHLIGPAWGASFLLAKTELRCNEIQAEEDDFVAALEWAESLGADVVSSSLGYYDWYTYEDMDGNTAVTTIGADIAASKGVTVVTAAGNEGPLPWPGIIAPSDGDSVIACGAVDSTGVLLGFSSRGPSYDGRIKPDVVAMGTAVVSASYNDSLGYLRTSGTSLSTPLIAGSVALLLQMHPYWTPVDVLNALRNEASKSATPDNNYGWGIIDAYASALNGATGILDGVVLSANVQKQLVTIEVEMPGAPPTPLNLQRQDWEKDGANTWTPYQNVKDSIYVDSITPLVYSETLLPGTYRYRVQLTYTPSTVSPALDVRVPHYFFLEQSYPNPFVPNISGRVTIPFTLGGVPAGPGETQEIEYLSEISLAIYDVTGALVRVLEDGLWGPGEHISTWDGLDDRGVRVSSGVYYCRLSVGSISLTRKLVLLR